MVTRSEKTKPELYAIVMSEFGNHPEAAGFDITIVEVQQHAPHHHTWDVHFIINQKVAPPIMRKIITRLQTKYTLV